MIEQEAEERLSIYRLMCAAFLSERTPNPKKEERPVSRSIPTQIVLVTKSDSPHPKFHVIWRMRLEGEVTTRCGLREREGHDVFLPLRHAVKFAEPCKSKKCFGD